MVSEINFEIFADEKKAWFDLHPHEQDATLDYNKALIEGCETSIMILEMIKIGDRVKDFCPILSVPKRYYKFFKKDNT